MVKFSFSANEETYHGEFDTREEAIAALNGHSGWTGENTAPPQPEEYWDADEWIDHVLCQDEYSMDAASDALHTTKEQREELESLVRPILAAWLDRHDLRPKFWLVENVQKHEATSIEPAVADAGMDGAAME